MYSIVLTDGKIINIKADEVEWCEKDRMIKLISNRRIVARINMDNVAGWIDTDYKAESDCRDCKEYKDCPCGKDGHESGTSQGYSIGECKDFEPQESEVNNG